MTFFMSMSFFSFLLASLFVASQALRQARHVALHRGQGPAEVGHVALLGRPADGHLDQDLHGAAQLGRHGGQGLEKVEK